MNGQEFMQIYKSCKMNYRTCKNEECACFIHTRNECVKVANEKLDKYNFEEHRRFGEWLHNLR